MNVCIAAEPTINNITTVPESPAPLSTITIIADISGEDISKVNLTVSECNDTACFLNQKVNMALNQDGKYEAQITLKDSEGRANHLQYLFKVALEDGTEYHLSEDLWKVYLDLGENGGENNNEDDNGEDGTPGFELLFLFIAIFISFLYYNKKR